MSSTSGGADGGPFDYRSMVPVCGTGCDIREDRRDARRLALSLLCATVALLPRGSGLSETGTPKDSLDSSFFGLSDTTLYWALFSSMIFCFLLASTTALLLT